MRAHIARVTARSAALVAVLLLAGFAGHAWWQHRAATVAERDGQVALIAAVVAVTTDDDALRAALTRASPAGRMAVHLTGGQRVGPSRATADQVARALRDGRPVTAGELSLHPVAASGGGTAVVEVSLPGEGIALGAAAGFVVAALLAVGLAVLAADRMSRPVVRQLRALAASGDGDQPARPPRRGGIAELAAITTRIDRVDEMTRQLVAKEHKLIADVSHRLRTPLTALLLDADAVGPGPVAERIRSAVVTLEHDVDDIIRAAGQAVEPIQPASTTCDLSEVVRRRMRFWLLLATNQGRHCEISCLDEPTPVALAEDAVAAVVDTLVGNIFRHTEPGTPLAVTVGHHDGWVSLVVDDGGPGIADPEAALRRGVSGEGSTGLGLDIARTGVEATGGTIHIERGKLGGARVRLRFAETGAHHGPEPRAWRLWLGRPSPPR